MKVGMIHSHATQRLIYTCKIDLENEISSCNKGKVTSEEQADSSTKKNDPHSIWNWVG